MAPMSLHGRIHGVSCPWAPPRGLRDCHRAFRLRSASIPVHPAPDPASYNGPMSSTAQHLHATTTIAPLSEWAFGPAPRRATRQVRIGNVLVGGDAPVVVQSMTNTDTADIPATVKQVAELWRAGSEMVRVTVNTSEAASAVPRIVDRLAM